MTTRRSTYPTIGLLSATITILLLTISTINASPGQQSLPRFSARHSAAGGIQSNNAATLHQILKNRNNRNTDRHNSAQMSFSNRQGKLVSVPPNNASPPTGDVIAQLSSALHKNLVRRRMRPSMGASSSRQFEGRGRKRMSFRGKRRKVRFIQSLEFRCFPSTKYTYF